MPQTKTFFCVLMSWSLLTGGWFSYLHPTGSEASFTVAHAASPAKVDFKTQQSIKRGLGWLISAIRRDGTVGPDLHLGPDLGCTAMVGLALLSEGSTPRGGTYQKESKRVMYGVLDLVRYRPLDIQAGQNITLVQRKIGANADLFLATLYLSQVYYEAPGDEEAIRAALDKLVKHICLTQGKDGTWGDESWAPILGTILGWESLRAASSAGLKIDASEKVVGEALIKKLKQQSSQETNWMHQFYKEAASVRVLYSMNYRNTPEFQACVDKILDTVQTDNRVFHSAGGEEYLAFYFVTECFLKEPREDWQSWYPKVRDQFLRTQNRDGSWRGHHCITDRTFCTAAALLTLLSPNFSLPTSDL